MPLWLAGPGANSGPQNAPEKYRSIESTHPITTVPRLLQDSSLGSFQFHERKKTISFASRKLRHWANLKPSRLACGFLCTSVSDTSSKNHFVSMLASRNELLFAAGLSIIRLTTPVRQPVCSLYSCDFPIVWPFESSK